MQEQTSYLFNEVEVVCTGRVAKKTGRGGKQITLHEVSPLDKEEGSWKRWVNLETLYVVMDG